MQNFTRKNKLENGLSWTAEYKSWDWAHHGRFYFVISLYQGNDRIKQLKVYTDDHAYGDTSCRQSKSDILKKVRDELHSLALAGESITDFV